MNFLTGAESEFEKDIPATSAITINNSQCLCCCLVLAASSDKNNVASQIGTAAFIGA